MKALNHSVVLYASSVDADDDVGIFHICFFSPARRITSEIKKNYFKINECGGGDEWRWSWGVM